jgi:hypothetical protein
MLKSQDKWGQARISPMSQVQDKWGQARISPMSQVRFQDKTKCATSGKAGFYVEKYGPGPSDSIVNTFGQPHEGCAKCLHHHHS